MINNEYPPLGGGQATANQQVVREWQRYSDYHVDVITASTADAHEQREKNVRLFFCDIGKRGRNLHFQSARELLRFFRMALMLGRRLCKSQVYDVMLCWSGVPAGIVGYVLHFFFGIPYIVLLRGADVPFWEDRWYWLDKLVLRWVSPFIWRHAEAVVANSQGLQEQALRCAPEVSILVVPNGVDAKLFHPPVIDAEQDETIIMVGRLIPRKQFDLAIASFAIARAQLPSFHLLIVGDGPEKGRLQQIAQSSGVGDAVEFRGVVTDRKEMARLYRHARLYAHLSINEGMSNTMLEAMASGLPCLVRATAGMEELMRGNGVVLTNTTATKIADKMVAMVSHQRGGERQGEQSRRIAESLSWQKVASAYEVIVSRVVMR